MEAAVMVGRSEDSCVAHGNWRDEVKFIASCQKTGGVHPYSFGYNLEFYLVKLTKTSVSSVLRNFNLKFS